MALGATLGELISDVQEEISSSTSPAIGLNFRDTIKSRINREYKRLFHDFDWPHLTTWSTRATAAGQRYYDLPDDLALETIADIYRRFGGEWHKLKRGLEPTHYNGQDSDDGYRSDPPLRWRPYGAEQIEIWPTPASASTLRFVGKRAYNPLVDESDTCDLDSDLIVLFAAGKLLKRRGANDADIVLAEAAAHYRTLRQRSQTGEVFNFAAGAPVDFDPFGGMDDRVFIGVAAGGSSSSPETLQFGTYVSDVPEASEILLAYDAGQEITLSASQSQASADVAANATTVFSLTRDGDEIGTVTFAAGSTEGVVSFTSSLLNIGQTFRVIAPASPDPLLENIRFTFVGEIP